MGELSLTELAMTKFWTDPATVQRLESLPTGDKEKFAGFIVDSVETSLMTARANR
jgi:hypothetical protein